MAELNVVQQVHMHLGFLSLEQVLPLVRMKKSNWYAKRRLGLVPAGQPHPIAENETIYTVDDIQALLRRMEAAGTVEPKAKGAA